MFPLSIVSKGFVNCLLLLIFLQGILCQPPILQLTFISEGCIVDGQSKVVVNGMANFTGRDSIGDWSRSLTLEASGFAMCLIQLDPCPSSEEDCYCQNIIDQEYRIVLNQTANNELTGRDVSIYANRVVLPLADERSNLLKYPQTFDPAEETVLFANSSSFDISSGILPDDVTFINYTVTGLQEPYTVMYSVSEPPTQEVLDNTTNIIANFGTSQRLLQFGYEELGPTCTRQFTHILCRKGGIEETVKFDDETASGDILPMNVTNLNYTLSGIIEPYVVLVTITYDGSVPVSHSYDNTSNILLAINGSREICIRYQETGTDRLSQCRGQRESCFSRESSSCSCDCDDWKEAHTIVLFIAMIIKLICGIILIIVYCMKPSSWPVITLGLSFGMVATALCNITIICYQEVSDCGLCDCHYAFSLVEMLITLCAVFFILILLYQETKEDFQKKWFSSLFLLSALAMIAISIIGVIVVFCNKEIAGSGVESWHIIFLLVAIAMAVIFVIGFIAWCHRGEQVDPEDSSSNGKTASKPPGNEHELKKTKVVEGRINEAFQKDETDKAGAHNTQRNGKPAANPPAYETMPMNSSESDAQKNGADAEDNTGGTNLGDGPQRLINLQKQFVLSWT